MQAPKVVIAEGAQLQGSVAMSEPAGDDRKPPPGATSAVRLPANVESRSVNRVPSDTLRVSRRGQAMPASPIRKLQPFADAARAAASTSTT